MLMAGDEGFEPPHGGVKVLCLTAWRIPKMGIKPAYCINIFYKSKGVFGKKSKNPSRLTARRHGNAIFSIPVGYIVMHHRNG